MKNRGQKLEKYYTLEKKNVITRELSWLNEDNSAIVKLSRILEIF